VTPQRIQFHPQVHSVTIIFIHSFPPFSFFFLSRQFSLLICGLLHFWIQHSDHQHPSDNHCKSVEIEHFPFSLTEQSSVMEEEEEKHNQSPRPSGPGLSQDDVEELRAKLQINLSWLATGTEDLLQDFKRQRSALKVQARKRRERERDKGHHSHSHHHHAHKREHAHHGSDEHVDHESGDSLHVSALSHEEEADSVDPVGYHSEGALAATPSQGATPRIDDEHYFSDEDWQTPFLAYSYTFRHSSRMLLSPDEKIRSDYMRASALKEDYLKRKK
jgi:hypothetical protein